MKLIKKENFNVADLESSGRNGVLQCRNLCPMACNPDILVPVEDFEVIEKDMGARAFRELVGKKAKVNAPDAMTPALLLMTPGVPLSSVTAPRRFNGNYDRESDRLNETDSNNLGKDLLKAYSDIVERALHASLSPLPLLLRYRMTDVEGNSVYVSPVKLFVPHEGCSFLKAFTCAVDDSGRGSFTVGADTFGVAVTMPGPDPEKAATVRKLVVEGAVPVPVVDVRVKFAENRINVNTSTLRFFMPGASVDMAADEVCLRRRIELMTAHFDCFCHTLLTVADPFGVSAETTIQVPLSALIARGVIADCASTLKKTGVLAETTNDIGVLRDRLLLSSNSLPHSYKSDIWDIGGNTYLVAAPEVTLWQGCPLTDWALETDASMWWQGNITVEMGDGSRRIVWSGEGYSHAPTALAPVWHYPHPDAVAMEIRMRTAKGTAVQRCGLKNVPMTAHSAGTGFPLRPLRLDIGDSDYRIPSSTVHTFDRPNVLLSGLMSRQNPLSAVELPCGRITAVVAAGASNSAWEFARHRFYVFTDEGTFLVVVGGKGDITAIQHLDFLKLENRTLIAHDLSTGSVVAAGAGRLFRYKGATVTEVAPCPAAVRSLAFDNGDLWILLADGSLKIMPQGISGFYNVDIRRFSDMSNHDGRIALLGEHGEYMRSDRRVMCDVATEWVARERHAPKAPARSIYCPCGSAFRDMVILDLTCCRINGSLKVTTDGGNTVSCLPATVADVDMAGSLRSAFAVPCRYIPPGHVTVALKADISPDALFRGIETLKLKDQWKT